MNITLNNVTKKFFSLRGTVTALENIHLEIKDKEFFVLLGPSGCGKSTLLNVIAGLEKISGGEIRFNDKVVASYKKRIFIPPKKRNVSMVFQSYALYPHMNVFENIAFPLRMGKEEKQGIKETVEKVAARLKISSLLNARPGELSGGQRQRVAIARAIIRHPNLFLLDEPLSNLDAKLRQLMRTELKYLQRSLGITTVFVTHDQIEAMTLGDRIALLKDGRLVQIGTPEELYNNPVNKFVATFIGSPAMNLLKTCYILEKGAVYVKIGEKNIQVPEEILQHIEKLTSNECILGIRPEHIYLNSKEAKNPFRAKIITIESLGKETCLHISVEKHRFSAVTQEKKFEEGEIITADFDLTKAHLFEPGE